MAEPQNFDEFYNGNRAFILGGQTFHWRPLHWREWGELIDRTAAEEEKEQKARKAKIDKLMKAGKTEEEAEEAVDSEEMLVDAYQDIVDRILVYLEPGEITGLKAILEDSSKQVSVAQLNAILVWLQGVQTPDRPTETPMASSPSPGTSGVTSPAA